jgi:hypothetical protein
MSAAGTCCAGRWLSRVDRGRIALFTCGPGSIRPASPDPLQPHAHHLRALGSAVVSRRRASPSGLTQSSAASGVRPHPLLRTRAPVAWVPHLTARNRDRVSTTARHRTCAIRTSWLHLSSRGHQRLSIRALHQAGFFNGRAPSAYPHATHQRLRMKKTMMCCY